MIQFLLHTIKPVMLMVFLATIAGFCLLQLHKKNNQLLVLILLISSLNEVATLLLQYYNQQTFIGTLYSISFPLFCLMWLLILYKNQIRKKTTLLFIVFFIGFAIVNFIWFEGANKFNYYTAAVGCFGFIGLLANESFIQLKKENFNFLLSNSYLLLMSPVLLFFGFGQMFAFVSRNITQTKIVNNITLFDMVVDFVNIVYYVILIVYMILEKKIASNE